MYAFKDRGEPDKKKLPTAAEPTADAKTPAKQQLAGMPFAQQSAALTPPGHAAGKLDQARIEAAMVRDPELLARAVERLGQDPEAARLLADRMKDHQDVQRFIAGRFTPTPEGNEVTTPGGYAVRPGEFTGLTVNAQNAAGPQPMNAAMMSQMGQVTGVQQPQNALEVTVETDVVEKAIKALGDVAKFIAWVAVKVVETLGQAARALVSVLPVGWLVTVVAQTLLGTKAGLLLLPLLFL